MSSLAARGRRVAVAAFTCAIAIAALPACRRAQRGPGCRAVATAAQAVARDAVATALRPGMGDELAATLGALADATLVTVERACREDRWPDALRACFAAAVSAEALRSCRDQMPAALRQRLVEPLLPGDLPAIVQQRIDALTP